MSDRLNLDHDPALATARTALRADVAFDSILFRAGGVDVSDAHDPVCFADLNLDQVVGSVVKGREEYDLTPFFYTPLEDVEEVRYRHEIFRDLEADEIRAPVQRFGEQMRRMRQYLTLAEKQQYNYEKERWFLDATTTYRDAVSTLERALTRIDLSSVGLRALRDYLSSYSASEPFVSFA
ncbi:MAG: MutS-related protein, partial [Solirubrobacteraceae bacterium]